MKKDRNLGLGVLIQMMGGNENSALAVSASLNKVIKTVVLDEGEDELKITFEDGTGIALYDGGQSCCEHRYMATDDDLEYYSGATFLEASITDGPDQEDEYGEPHEIQFLDIKTSKGTFQMSNHNEHNGYYGGFYIMAKLITS